MEEFAFESDSQDFLFPLQLTTSLNIKIAGPEYCCKIAKCMIFEDEEKGCFR